MGTTAQKLNRVLETKSDLKTVINYSGANITNETTFKDYPKLLNKAYIDILNDEGESLYNALPKTTTTGTSLDLNTEKGKMKIELKGDTQQNISILPGGYTQVDYIQSSGTQYIDSGILPSENIGFEIDFTPHNDMNRTTAKTIFGSRTTWKSNGYQLTTYTEGTLNGGHFLFGTNDTASLIRHSAYMQKDVRCQISFLNGVFKSANGNETNIQGTFSNVSKNIYLFGGIENVPFELSTITLYKLKFYDNGNLIRDFIPCYRNSDNVVGLYDLVNNVFYTNQGTGAFTYGSVANIPNPDYPQDIHVITGSNNLKIQNRNLLYSNLTYPFDTHGVTVTQEDDGSITLNGTQSGGAMHIIFNNAFFDDIKKYDGKEISISLTTSGQGSFSNFGIKNGTSVDLLIANSPSLSKTQTLNLNNNTNIYFDIWFNNTSRTFVNYNIKPQVEVGKATTYEPYQTQNYIINLVGKNLFDKNNMKVLNGYLWSNEMVLKDSFADRIFYLPCQPNTTYTISRSVLTTSFRVATYNNIIPTVTSERVAYTCYNEINNDNGETITITTQSDSKYLLVLYANTTNDNNIEESLATIQIEKGSTATTFEPYMTPLELCKIGDYQDYIFRNDNKWYKHNAIGKVVLDDSYGWTRETNASWICPRFTCTTLPNLGTTVNNTTFKNTFSNYSKYNGTSYTATKNSHLLRYVNNTNRIDCMFELASVEELKALLAVTPMVIYYPLITPTETQITDTTLIQQLDNLKNAKSYDDVTHITQTNDDLPFNLEVSALAKIE